MSDMPHSYVTCHPCKWNDLFICHTHITARTCSLIHTHMRDSARERIFQRWNFKLWRGGREGGKSQVICTCVLGLIHMCAEIHLLGRKVSRTCMCLIHMYVCHTHVCVSSCMCVIHMYVSHSHVCMSYTCMCLIHMYVCHTHVCVSYTCMCVIMYVCHTHVCVSYKCMPSPIYVCAIKRCAMQAHISHRGVSERVRGVPRKKQTKVIHNFDASEVMADLYQMQVCVAVCCSVLQCVAVCFRSHCRSVSDAGVCCSVLQCVAVCCSVLQFVACR